MRIHDIARIAGVSTATVSRAINNSGYVKEETKERIFEVISSNNYVPSAIARSLSTNHSMNIGVIIPDIENDFFAKIISGISEIATKNGFNVFFFGTGENSIKEHDALRVFMEQRLRGLIIAPISETDKKTRRYLKRIKSDGTPIVLVDRNIEGENFNGVFADNVNGAYAAVEVFAGEGHTRIATISGPTSSTPGKGRLEGFLKAMNDFRIPIIDEYIVEGDFKIDRAYQCANELLSLKHPPTAVFASNNLSTLGFLKSVRERDVKLGSDVSIIGYDAIEAFQIIDYSLSVICRDAVDQGRKAMDMLLERITNSDMRDEAKQIVMPFQVELKGSEKFDRTLV